MKRKKKLNVKSCKLFKRLTFIVAKIYIRIEIFTSFTQQLLKYKKIDDDNVARIRDFFIFFHKNIIIKQKHV